MQRRDCVCIKCQLAPRGSSRYLATSPVSLLTTSSTHGCRHPCSREWTDVGWRSPHQAVSGVKARLARVSPLLDAGRHSRVDSRELSDMSSGRPSRSASVSRRHSLRPKSSVPFPVRIAFSVTHSSITDNPLNAAQSSNSFPCRRRTPSSSDIDGRSITRPSGLRALSISAGRQSSRRSRV